MYFIIYILCKAIFELILKKMKFNELYLIYAFTEAQKIGLSVHNEATVLVMH
jgi:hypothetical protein